MTANVYLFNELLCPSCLCVDKQLHDVTTFREQQFFIDAVNEIPSKICWECQAMVRKATMFQEQVIESWRILTSYSVTDNPNFLASSFHRKSRLMVQVNPSVDVGTPIEIDVMGGPDLVKDESLWNGDYELKLEDAQAFENDYFEDNLIEDFSASETKDFVPECKTEKDSEAECKRKRKKEKVLDRRKKKRDKEELRKKKTHKNKKEKEDNIMKGISTEELASENNSNDTQPYTKGHKSKKKKIFVCDICGKQSYTLDRHRYHRDTHKARVQCPQCDKTFSHRAGLMNHTRAFHNQKTSAVMYTCEECGKTFRWKNSFKKHVLLHKRKDGDGPTPVAFCSPCNVPFASICSYRRHLRDSLKHVSKHELKYVCDHCNKRFANKTKIRDHIEEKHLFKTYQCSICLKASKNRVTLDQHIRNVHKGRPNNKMCHHCGKGFPTNKQLESHIRAHTGERPFVCPYCPCTFSQRSNLYKHNKQLHMGRELKNEEKSEEKGQNLTMDTSNNDVNKIFQYNAVVM